MSSSDLDTALPGVDDSTDGTPSVESIPAPLVPMAVSLLALCGLFISIYTYLFSIGMIGEMVCGISGGCAKVQTSAYAYFPAQTWAAWGLPVPLLGIFGYGAIFATALARVVLGRPVRLLSRALGLLAAGGFFFSLYLTAVEAFVLNAWCRWCVVSAVLATLIYGATLQERLRR
jgi:uncharacterized membrane protein